MASPPRPVTAPVAHHNLRAHLPSQPTERECTHLVSNLERHHSPIPFFPASGRREIRRCRSTPTLLCPPRAPPPPHLPPSHASERVPTPHPSSHRAPPPASGLARRRSPSMPSRPRRPHGELRHSHAHLPDPFSRSFRAHARIPARRRRLEPSRPARAAAPDRDPRARHRQQLRLFALNPDDKIPSPPAHGGRRWRAFWLATRAASTLRPHRPPRAPRPPNCPRPSDHRSAVEIRSQITLHLFFKS